MSTLYAPTRSGRRTIAASFVLGFSLLAVVAPAGIAQASPPCGKLVFLTGPQTVVAGAVSAPITLEARKRSVDRCAIPGGSLAVGLSVTPASGGFFADAAGTIPTSSATLSSAAPHRATIYYFDTVPGARSITATHASLGSVSQTETVVSAALGHLSLAGPATAAPGIPFSMTVSALDRFDNAIPGYLGTVHFSTSDVQGLVPSDYTFVGADAGTHVFSGGFTLNTAGSRSISVTDGPIHATMTVAVGIEHQVAGIASGAATLSIIPNVSTCASPAATPSDHLCQYNLRGTYAEGGYLADGTISGRIILDDRAYGPNATYGVNCYSGISGIVKFISAQGTLRTKIDDATSLVCDTTGGGEDTHLRLLGQPGGNAGVYVNVVGGALDWNGTWTVVDATSFAHTDTFAGSILTG